MKTLTIKLVKKLPDGRYSFCKNGTYIALTEEDVESMLAQIKEASIDLIEEYINSNWGPGTVE